jgi:hypothetical protein
MFPPPPGSGKKFKEYTLLRGLSVDVVPYTGSLEACRRISQLYDYSKRGVIEIIEEE